MPRNKGTLTEQLTYSVNQVGYKNGRIILNWGYIEIEIPFETNYLVQFKEEVQTRANEQEDYMKWVVFLQGAEYLEEIHSNSELAMSWINQAEKIMDSTLEWNKQFYPRDYVKCHLYWIKAKLLAKKGNYKEAIKYGEKIRSIENDIFYKRNNEEENIDRILKKWADKI